MDLNVSIITTTYNSAATVAETLRSVRDQDYPLIEHLVIDGLSKDNTLEIVRQFPHVSLAISEKDEGIYDAMNKGIRAATGDIIGILNSDDIYASNQVISRVAEVFQDPSVQACYADLQYMDARDSSRITRSWKSGSYRPGSFYWGGCLRIPLFLSGNQFTIRLDSISQSFVQLPTMK